MDQHQILMIIAPDQFRDEELFEPYECFTKTHHWAVTVASTRTGDAKGMLGGSYKVAHTLSDIHPKDYDALVVVGGMGSPEYLWQNEDLRNLVKTFYQQGKVVSAICLSGVVLANAGVITGKSATVWEMPESLEAFEKAGVSYLNQDVVTDGHLITANGPHAAKAFAEAIAQTLKAATAV